MSMLRDRALMARATAGRSGRPLGLPCRLTFGRFGLSLTIFNLELLGTQVLYHLI